MLPRWHIFFGAIFTLVVWYFVPKINYIYIALLFLSSFLIDFDHYVAGFLKTRKLSLRESFKYHNKLMEKEKAENKKGIRVRGDFHLFHTVEFHALIGLLGLLWAGFFYIFVGMIFHSLIDVISLLRGDRFYRREFFFFNWLRKRI